MARRAAAPCGVTTLSHGEPPLPPGNPGQLAPPGIPGQIAEPAPGNPGQMA